MQAARHRTTGTALAMQIEASGLSVERGGRRIFAGLGFCLGPGEALVVRGPNGAGKSTLLRALAGLLPLAAGRIVLSPETEARRGELCHYIGHADALKPALTLTENLAFSAALLGGRDVGRAIGRLGLAAVADLPAAYLSAGQKRRAALARLVAVATSAVAARRAADGAGRGLAGRRRGTVCKNIWPPADFLSRRPMRLYRSRRGN